MSNLKYFDNINKAILKAKEKLGKDATLAYLEGYISSLKITKNDYLDNYYEQSFEEDVDNEDKGVPSVLDGI